MELGWKEIGVRLFLTVLGGALLGLNREEHGRAAGLRTTLLVCLAASLSMIQVNLLLGVAGKAHDSFVVMDLMRLPLGILSGMGFIGGGAILRKGELVRGVTTAATLWFVTVMGLCFGGGQLGLGIIALVLGMAILAGFKRLEKVAHQDCRARLALVADTRMPTEDYLRRVLTAAGYKLAIISVSIGENATWKELHCELHWHGRSSETRPPAFLKSLTEEFRFQRADWELIS